MGKAIPGYDVNCRALVFGGARTITTIWIKVFHSTGPWKELIAFVLGAAVCLYWDFDAFSVLMTNEKVKLFGTILTGAIIAGGSKASLKIFRDVLKFRSTAEQLHLEAPVRTPIRIQSHETLFVGPYSTVHCNDNHDWHRTIRTNTIDVKATDFELDKATQDMLIEKGREATAKYLQEYNETGD